MERLVPRHKFRERKRYYRRLRAEAAEFDGELLSGTWANLAHRHVDWRGYGNLGWRHRRQHLAVLFSDLDRAMERLSAAPLPLQVWLLIHEDSSADALYYHTPNPHTEFPFRFDGVDWTARPPPWLAPFIDTARHEFGMARGSHEASYFVRPRLRTAD